MWLFGLVVALRSAMWGQVSSGMGTCSLQFIAKQEEKSVSVAALVKFSEKNILSRC